jgi:hypothetical protein
VQRGAATPLLATLTDSAGQPLDQKTVIFVVNQTGSPFVTSAITDFRGRAALGPVPLPSGTYGVSVCFGGGTIAVGGQSVTLTDPLYQSSPQGGCSSPQAGGSITLTAADTTATIGSSVNPSVVGQEVTFTARASAAAAALGLPTGSVTFFDGTTAVGSAALNAAGQATFTTSSLSAGSHAITAVYAGDPNFKSSTSTVLTQRVVTVGETGVLKVCKALADETTAPEDTLFTFSVAGRGTISVAPGTCALLAAVPAGSATITETGSSAFSVSDIIFVAGSGTTDVPGGSAVATVVAGHTTEVLFVNRAVQTPTYTSTRTSR